MECWNLNSLVSLPSAGLSSSFYSVNVHLNSYVRPSVPSSCSLCLIVSRAFSRPYVYTYNAFISFQVSFYSFALQGVNPNRNQRLGHNNLDKTFGSNDEATSTSSAEFEPVIPRVPGLSPFVPHSCLCFIDHLSLRARLSL